MDIMHTQSPKKTHEGRNMKRFREMLGIKQDALATILGRAWSQKKISLMESRPIINHKDLLQVARVLKVPPDAIRNFDEQQAMINLRNNFETNNFNFNPVEKLIETLEELKQLYKDSKNLYDSLLKKECKRIKPG